MTTCPYELYLSDLSRSSENGHTFNLFFNGFQPSGAGSRLTGAGDFSAELETALFRLEEEQQRNASLHQINSVLRSQLDEATNANQSLTSDIHKLTQEWQRTREELDWKEGEWREEEQVRIIDLGFQFRRYSLLGFLFSPSMNISHKNTTNFSSCGVQCRSSVALLLIPELRPNEICPIYERKCKRQREEYKRPARKSAFVSNINFLWVRLHLLVDRFRLGL